MKKVVLEINETWVKNIDDVKKQIETLNAIHYLQRSKYWDFAKNDLYDEELAICKNIICNIFGVKASKFIENDTTTAFAIKLKGR